MARGYPDFFGTAIFPKYGGASQQDAGDFGVANGDTDVFLTIVGKGRSYGGLLRFWGTGNVHTNARIFVNVDGTEFASQFPDQQLEQGIFLSLHQFIKLVGYYQDDVNEYVTYTYVGDFTFEQSIVLSLENTSGALVLGQSWFWWALVA